MSSIEEHILERLKLYNGMVLIENDEVIKLKDAAESDNHAKDKAKTLSATTSPVLASSESSSPTNIIPCKKVLVLTGWKRRRDDLLVSFLSSQNFKKPVLILLNSVVEVNLMASALREVENKSIRAVGTILPTIRLQHEINLFKSSPSPSELNTILILSAPMALIAFVHGFINFSEFSVVVFADARGANQNHPFCVLMNNFYTPLKFPSIEPRIVGFAELDRVDQIEKDMFSRRDWQRNLKHFTQTFHSVPLPLSPDFPIQNYLDSTTFSQNSPISPLYSLLSNYESVYCDHSNSDESSSEQPEPNFPFDHFIVKSLSFQQLLESLESINFSICRKIVLLHIDITIEQIITILLKLKEKDVKEDVKVIHFHSSSKFAAQLSIATCLKSLSSFCTQTSYDPSSANDICKDATSLFSQSTHFIKCSSNGSNFLRNAVNGSLASPVTSIPILVRACALLARPFRQGLPAETIRFKTIKVFMVDESGKKTFAFSSHVSLLTLPPFFHQRIEDLIKHSQFVPSIPSFHLQGPSMNSRHSAQAAVAFEAVKMLRSAGILDENLLLSEEFREAESFDPSSIDDTDQQQETNNVGDQQHSLEVEEDDEITKRETPISFNELIPRKLIKNDNCLTLYSYAIEYELCSNNSPSATSTTTTTTTATSSILLTPFSRLLLAAVPSINFFSVSKSSKSWSIILPSRLPSAFVPIEIPIGPDHFLRTRLIFLSELSTDSPEYHKLLQAQSALFGMFNIKPITVPNAEDIISLNESSAGSCCASSAVPADKMVFYLIAPLVDSNLTADNTNTNELVTVKEIPLVWDLFQKFIKAFKAAPVDGAVYSIEKREKEQKRPNWTIDWNLIEQLDTPKRGEGGEEGDSLNLLEYIKAVETFSLSLGHEDSIQLEEGGVLIDFKRFALERLAFHSPHTKTFYRLNRPHTEPLTPASSFTSAAYPNVSTHAEYVNTRYALEVKQMDQELLSVKRVENWSDLAIWISDDGGTKKRRKKTPGQKSALANISLNTATSTSSPSFIIPELTEIVPCAYSMIRLAMLIPRVSFEIERQFRISEFFADKIPATITTPCHSRQVEGMTSLTAALSYSYEQLEVLGDSFLKYYSTLDTLIGRPTWSEGRLSSHRQQILCNANLRKAAERLDLLTYASFTPFFAKLWCPPPLKPLLPSTSNTLDQVVQDVLFSPEERWRALALVEGKQVQRDVVYLLNPQGKLEIDPNHKTREQAKNSTGSIFKYGQLIPPKSLADLLESLIAIYYIDGGTTGALQFLTFCGILRSEVFDIRKLNPIELLVGDANCVISGESEQIAKMKRRKLTPISGIILQQDQEQSGSGSSSNGTAITSIKNSSTAIPSHANHLQAAQSIDVTVSAIVENVQPSAPSFLNFPFEELEKILGHSPFKHRELLFMACTHSSIDGKLCNERLEWIGDAAIDWIVCQHYWYNFRVYDHFNENDSEYEHDSESEAVLSRKEEEAPLDDFTHDSLKKIPTGFLTLSPEDLTNSRQSAINNEAFARLSIRFGLNKFLRINSPHLQIEVGRFEEEIKRELGLLSEQDHQEKSTTNTPDSLNKLHTHVSVAAPKVLGDLFEALAGALLLDTNFNIATFETLLQPFVEFVCAIPSDLPTNAIQETLHLYARLGIPRHQIVCTYKDISTTSVLGVICQVWVKDRCVAEAEGSNRFVAKKLAMERALADLKSEKNVQIYF